jgi:TPR repeat protein
MKKLLTALVIIVSLGMAGSVCAQDFQKQKALAEQGNATAQYNLGVMYDKGQGVVQDYKEAGKWYLKAAEQGLAEAQFNLGAAYFKGDGVLQDNVFAHMWFNIAASNGDTDAVKNRDIVAKGMTAADISKAQGLARACVAKKYKGC